VDLGPPHKGKTLKITLLPPLQKLERTKKGIPFYLTFLLPTFPLPKEKKNHKSTHYILQLVILITVKSTVGSFFYLPVALEDLVEDVISGG